MGHELYCAGHLIQAGVAFARATGDTTLLSVARRFADLIDDVFGSDPARGTDGHPEVEVALVELYRQTGEARYLELADTLTARRGYGMFAGGRFDLDYYQDAEPVRDARARSSATPCAPSISRPGSPTSTPRRATRRCSRRCSRQWDDLTSAKTYLTGGVGSRHYGEAIGDPYELPPDRAYCETCASIASIMWNWRMLLVTGESRFADLLRADALQRVPLRALARRRVVLLLEPAAVADRRAPPSLESRRLLPAEHHAAARVAAPLPRDRDGRRDPAPSVRVVDDPRRDPGAGPVELTVETSYPWSGTVTVEVVSSTDRRVDARRSGSRAGRERRPSTASRSPRVGTPTLTTALAGRRPRRPRTRRLAATHRARIRASTPFAGASRSNAARSSTASSSTTFRAGADLADVAARSRSRSRRQRPGRAAGRPARCVACGRRPRPRRLAAHRVPRSPRAAGATRQSPTQLLAVPYFAWANRAGGGMRVWIPAAE